MTTQENAEPTIELMQKYYIDEDAIDKIYNEDGDRIEGPIADIPGEWQIAAKATIFLGRGRPLDSVSATIPMNLSHIGMASTALREAMVTLDPPVVLEEYDSRIQIDSSYHDTWNPGLSGGQLVDKFQVVTATYEERFAKNQDVPQLAPESLLPELDIDDSF